ncbi:MAG TPA: hypothetical protein PLS34_05700 [Gammaproteobacteria bacterium]|nr:hypothetical protein [Gammaproteobacteria bacterium]
MAADPADRALMLGTGVGADEWGIGTSDLDIPHRVQLQAAWQAAPPAGEHQQRERAERRRRQPVPHGSDQHRDNLVLDCVRRIVARSPPGSVTLFSVPGKNPDTACRFFLRFRVGPS